MKTPVLLAGIAVLLLGIGAAHADADMPDTLRGDWCWIAGGDKSNWNQQTFIRSTPEDCHVADGLISIDQNGWTGEGSCLLEKIEQIADKVYLIQASCDGDDHGQGMLELVGDKLIITSLPEG
jgi:hypothetical protein